MNSRIYWINMFAQILFKQIMWKNGIEKNGDWTFKVLSLFAYNWFVKYLSFQKRSIGLNLLFFKLNKTENK